MTERRTTGSHNEIDGGRAGSAGDDRADQRLEEDVADRLGDDENVDPSAISIHAHAGEVTLNGMVNSEEQKRAAQAAVESVPDADAINNELRVRGGETGDQIGNE